MQLEFECRQTYRSGFQIEAAFSTEAAVTALFGPSGAGKTTVLMILAGLLRGEVGRLRLNDRVLADSQRGIWTPPQERRIGCVFQDQRLFPHLCVRDNLQYGRRRLGPRGLIERFRRRHSAARLDFDRVVAALELGALLTRSPDRLSGGERQRVALGRALLQEPALLLMDEPTTALDEPLKERILDFVVGASSEFGVPLLFVSHQARDVGRRAQRVIVMKAGRVSAVGAPEEVLAGGAGERSAESGAESSAE